MADNVQITAGSGTTIGTDEVTISATAVQVQYMKVLDATANGTNALVVDSGGRISVNVGQVGAGTVSTVATGVQKVGTADSAGNAFLSAANALNSTGTGLQAVQLAAQFDDTSPQTVTENQFGNLRMSAKGVLYGTIRDAAGNERGANVDASNRLSVTVDNVSATNISTNVAQIGGTTVVNGGVAGSLAIGGTTAAGSTVANNPVQLGARARTTNPTAVSDDQVVRITANKLGHLVVAPFQVRDLITSQTTTITASTSETTIVTAAASTFHDLTCISITNSSSTNTLVTLKDSTGGTTRAIWHIPGYSGIVVPFPGLMKQEAAVNNNWTLTCGSSVSSLYVNVTYVKHI